MRYLKNYKLFESNEKLYKDIALPEWERYICKGVEEFTEEEKSMLVDIFRDYGYKETKYIIEKDFGVSVDGIDYKFDYKTIVLLDKYGDRGNGCVVKLQDDYYLASFNGTKKCDGLDGLLQHIKNDLKMHK